MKTTMMLALLLLAAGVCTVEAWGRSGHRITAMIAQSSLSETAQGLLQKWYGQPDLFRPSPAYQNGPINWPDDYDHSAAGAWSYDLHFAYTKSYPYFNYDCDCVNTCTQENADAGWCSTVGEVLLDCCVVAGIEKYRDELYLQIVEGQTNATAGAGNTNNATIKLMLLAHFTGDIHQPLHVGIYNDKGGNTFNVSFFGNTTCGTPPWQKPCQLHEVWDSLLIDRYMQDTYGDYNPNEHGVDQRELAFAAAIEAEYSLAANMTLHEEKVFSWASDSVGLAACLYLNDPFFNVDQHYLTHAITTIKMQLYRAGLRIGQLLNEVVGEGGPCPLCSWKAPLCRAAPAGYKLPSSCGPVPPANNSKYAYFRNNDLW